MNLKKLGKLINEKRKQMKLSLRDAADGIGISHNYLSIIEKASDPRSDIPIRPTIETLQLLGDYFDISISILLDLAGYNLSALGINQTPYFNKEALSILLEKAKGDRSLNQFGLRSRVDAGYLSRLINQKVENPPSPEILMKIGDVAHNGVTYEELMKVVGYITNAEQGNVAKELKDEYYYIAKELQDNDISIEDIRALIEIIKRNRQ